MVVEDLVLQFGYAGLLAVSFLAATVLPLGSEALVAVMPAAGYDRGWVFAVATAGNVLGALANYGIGRWGRAVLRERALRGAAIARAERAFARFGLPALLFSWLPVIGDPLTIVAGALRANPAAFICWVTVGKAARYAAVLWLAGQVGSGAPQ